MRKSLQYGLFIGLFAFFAYGLHSAGSRKHDGPKFNSKNAVEVKTVAKLDEMKGENSLILVDFYADWCPPCQQMGPHIGKLADNYSKDVKVVLVNVDDAGELAKSYEIASLPTLVLIKDGKIIAKEVGYKNYVDLEVLIKKHQNVKG